MTLSYILLYRILKIFFFAEKESIKNEDCVFVENKKERRCFNISQEKKWNKKSEKNNITRIIKRVL